MSLPGSLRIFKDTAVAWNADKAPRLAAALSYSTIFSIAPLFIIATAIAGTVLGMQSGVHGHREAESQLVGFVQRHVGSEAADAVRGMVAKSFSKTSSGIWAQVIGYVTFLIGASGLFASLQDSLNTVWDVQPPSHSGIWLAIRDRAAAIGMVLVIGMLLLATLAVNAGVAIASTWLTQRLPFPGAAEVFGVVNGLVSIVVLTALFALLFKYLPDAEIAWRDVWIGAALTSFLFVVGQFLISFYIARSGVASAYGAAGALLAILTWIYYSALILLFGAEFTKVYANTRGSRAPLPAAAGINAMASPVTASP